MAIQCRILRHDVGLGRAWPTCEQLSTNHRFSTGILLAFAVFRWLQFVLPFSVVLCASCASTRDLAGKTGASSPRYGWLRKQGTPVDARTAYCTPAIELSANAVHRPSGFAATSPIGNGTGPDIEPRDVPPAIAGQGAVPACPAPVAPSRPSGKHLTALRTAAAKDSSEYYAPAPRHWNTKAIAAAPAALATVVVAVAAHSVPVLVLGGAIAFALGLIGSRQCRDREERGKGFALVGMVVGAVALFVGLMAVILTA